MLDRIKEFLGLEKQSRHVKDFIYDANIKASIYMSVVVIILEVWMIIRRIHKEMTVYYDPAHGFDYYFERFRNYSILLIAGLCVFIYAVAYYRGKTTNHTLGSIIIWSFSFIGIYFGMMVSMIDYSKGEQILTFLTMELFIMCLLTWKPLIGVVILSVSYILFYWQMDAIKAPNTGELGTTEATQINYFIMWLSTLMFCFSNYNRLKYQAVKDENLEEANRHLSRISVEDELTGIHNMLYFRTEAEKLMSYVITDKESMVFLFFDIENFKSYNEKYGFHAGNELLVKVAHLIDDSFAGSLVSRFSDDHFVVLTKNEGSMETISGLAERVHDLQRDVQLTLKCGAYRPSGEETDPSVACDRARLACTSIKKRYDQSFRMYDKALEDRFYLKQYIVNNIDTAIASGYIKVYYQPVVSTASGRICGFEALARWLDPNYGLLSPAAFISTLEEYRQIHKLDKCIMEQVCRDYRSAKDKGLPFVPVSLNFSRLDFELCDIVGYLCKSAEEYNVPRNFLDVEITESALNEQRDFLQSAMKVLRSAGFNIWLDDFGSGYSSLNVLKDYQFDVMKIDMKFLTGFASNKKTRTILKNIVGLTKQLNMMSLTEGVETKEQFEFLKRIGCDRTQGYLFSKPVPLEEMYAKIESGELAIANEYMP